MALPTAACLQHWAGNEKSSRRAHFKEQSPLRCGVGPGCRTDAFDTKVSLEVYLSKSGSEGMLPPSSHCVDNVGLDNLSL